MHLPLKAGLVVAATGTIALLWPELFAFPTFDFGGIFTVAFAVVVSGIVIWRIKDSSPSLKAVAMGGMLAGMGYVVLVLGVFYVAEYGLSVFAHAIWFVPHIAVATILATIFAIPMDSGPSQG